MAQLSPAAVRHYHREGYCAPIRVMSAGETLDLRRKLEAIEASGRLPIRIGLAVGYLPTCVRETAGMTDGAMLVHGCDRFGRLVEQRPHADLSGAAIARQGQVSGASLRILMRGTDRATGDMASWALAEGSKGTSKSRCAMPVPGAARTATL